MGGFKKALSMMGLADVSEADDEPQEQEQEDYSDYQEPDFTTSYSQTQAALPPVSSEEKPDMDYQPAATPTAQIAAITPNSFDDAQKIGMAIRQGIPVIMNLTKLNNTLAFRIVDFSSGVVFGLQGSIERVTDRVFLLSPHGIQVSVSDSTAHDKNMGLFDAE